MGLLQVVKESAFSHQRPKAGHWPAVEWKDWINFLARIWWCAFPFNTSHRRDGTCASLEYESYFFPFMSYDEWRPFTLTVGTRAVGFCYLLPKFFPSAHARRWSRETTTLGTRIYLSCTNAFWSACELTERLNWMSFSQKTCGSSWLLRMQRINYF